MFRSKAKRRKRLRALPLSTEWQRFLYRAVPLVRRLPEEDRNELHGHLQVLLSEKHFEGAGGLEITDEMEFTVCAQAAVLLLHRNTDYFPKLITILIYPGPYGVRKPIRNEQGIVADVLETRAGESWTWGTVVLSWENVQRDLARTHGTENVILHEFAHQLDAGSGAMDGAPLLSEERLRKQWPQALSQAFARLESAAQAHIRTVLRPYGAKNPSEFFAVATEAFFQQPMLVRQSEPQLYHALCQYFKQDPAKWA